MARILQPFEQLVVSNDLTSDHVLGDIFFSLERLHSTIGNIFDRIGKRIEDENNRVKLVNERVLTCQNKVKHITGSNKATTIFSTAKFPAPKYLPPPHTFFSKDISQIPLVYPEPEDDVYYAPAELKRSSLCNPELSEELTTIYGVLNYYGSGTTLQVCCM